MIENLLNDAAAFSAMIEKNQLASDMARRQAMMDEELLQDCNEFITRSARWRKSSYEENWQMYQRNADSTYDPDAKAAKESWQAKAFIPITASHKGTIHASLYKTMMGPQPMLEMKARLTMPSEVDQSQNIRDIIIREIDKSRFKMAFNAVSDEAETYGSGFYRIIWETKREERVVRQPVYAPVDPMALEIAAQRGSLPAQPQIIGYQEVVEPVVTYRGVRCEAVSIWDVFPDPKALDVKGNQIAIRYDLTYGDIVRGVKEGWAREEALSALSEVEDGEKTPEDKEVVQSDRNISESEMKRTPHARKLECFERYAKLPKKWILKEMADTDDPDSLIPARVIFHKQVLIAVEPATEYDGEAPIYKQDYWKVAGQFYGRGIPEMLKDIQQVVNEGVNQRLDALAIILNPRFAIVDKFLVDKRDLEDKFKAIRLSAKAMEDAGVSDIRAAFQQVLYNSLDRAAFIDVQEFERYAQEITSANRVSLGTAGQVKDANQTLGGMELLRQAQGEKMAYIGMMIEAATMEPIFRAYWKIAYSNYEMQDIVEAIGPERAATFILHTPEDIDRMYAYVPQGVYTQENKAMLQARIERLRMGYGMFPWFDTMASFDKEAQSADIAPDELKLSPEEMQQKIVAEGLMSMQPPTGNMQESRKPRESRENNAKR